MITREREATERKPDLGTPAGHPDPGGPARPPAPPDGGGPAWPWWMGFPPVPGRPRPMNRRNLMIGTAIFGPLVLVVDALLGTAAGLVSSSLRVGLMVGGGMALISCLELAVVAWAAKVRQDREAGI